jgi:hypothetical protein
MTVPASLLALLEIFRPCFTAPTFTTFCGLVTGLIGRSRRRSVVGMLIGAGLERLWPHDRVHRFFSAAAWSIDALGSALATLIVAVLADPDAPIEVAVDDTLFHRCGKKVFGAFWQHDGSAAGPKKIGYGNCFVVVAIVVCLPFMDRAVALPVLARLHVKGGATKVETAAALVGLLAALFPGRKIAVVADAAYHSRALRTLPAAVSWTCRLPRNAVLYDLAPPRTGRRGRPRLKGKRLGTPADLADAASFTRRTLRLYDQVKALEVAEVRCLWYGSFHTRPVRVILVRDTAKARMRLFALVTTDLDTPAAQIVIGYSRRWAIEQAFLESRHVLGVGEAHNRTAAAVQRTVPFQLIVYSLIIVWYARHGHHAADVQAHRARAPWYVSKAHPSFEDMLSKLRRTLIAARFTGKRAGQPTPAEILDFQLACAAAAA